MRTTHLANRKRVWGGWAVVRLAALLMLLAARGVSAEEGHEAPAQDDQIDAQLAAGEFSAVWDSAKSLDDSVRRDQVFEQLAVAQARSGSYDGAAHSIRAILDSSVRQRALGTMRTDSGGNLAGGSQADFQSLIDLITTTVEPTSWDIAGGPGAVSEFAGGVFVDTDGVMRRVLPSEDASANLQDIFERGRRTTSEWAATEARHESELRYVSLPRLEREIELRQLAGQPIDESMKVLAGLRRVQYIFVYPDTGDLVVAGPAGDWKEQDNRVVSVATGGPVVRLEDLVLLMRRERQARGQEFGCSITPRQENLARTQEYLAETTTRPLRAGERDKWIAGIREALGRQDISIFGLPANTRVARVLVDADYHMKLIGMGLADGVAGVESYLDFVPMGPNDPPQPMSILRWWFTLNYEGVATTRDRLAFEIRGPGVRVLSENELLTQQGERVHTGASDELTARFAANFTRHFADLAQKYPVYAELRNVFDLALAVALCEEHGLYEQAGWQASAMLDPRVIRIAPSAVPREVDSVVNHRAAGGRGVTRIVVGVSGGVSVDPRPIVRAESLKLDDYGTARQNHQPLPRELNAAAWWWDGVLEE